MASSHAFGTGRSPDNEFDDLPAQHHLPLLGDEALLAVADAAQQLLEPYAVELAGRRCGTSDRR